MHPGKLYFYPLIAVLALTAGVPGTVIASERAHTKRIKIEKQKIVIQVSDNDPTKWNLALNNAQNVQEELGKDKVAIEIVAYGPGLNMLKLDSSASNRVQEAISEGVKIVACENTMRKQKLTRDDMLPSLDYAVAGVVELAQKQKEGYAYIRP